MSCKRIKQTETPEVHKQSQITDFFKNSTLSNRKKLFVDSSVSPKIKMLFHKGKMIDTTDDDDDFESPVPERSPLPYSLSSDEDESLIIKACTVNHKKKAVKMKNKPLKNELVDSSGNKTLKEYTVGNAYKEKAVQNIMQLNMPSSSKAKHLEAPRAISSPKINKGSFTTSQAKVSEKVMKPDWNSSKMDTLSKSEVNGSSNSTLMKDQLSKTQNITVKENLVLTPKKSCSKAFTDEKLCRDVEVESPSKKIKVDLSTEETTEKMEINIKFDIAGVSFHNTTPSNNNSMTRTMITVKDKTPTTSPKKNTKFSPKTSPKKNTKCTPRTSPTGTKRKDSLNKSESKEASSSNYKIELEEDEKLNVAQMELLKSLFIETLQDKDKKELLTTEDIHVIEEFLKMNDNHQYFLMKLYLYQPLWYNMQKFCGRIKLGQKLSPQEIVTMYEYHKNSIFVYTDLNNLSTDELLNMLSVGELKNTVDYLKLRRQNRGSKANIIEYLKKNCRTQSTLTMHKSSEDILKDAARRSLGYCIKLKDNVRSSFNKAYVLQTFSNTSYCEDVQSYLKDVGYIKVVYPNYGIENFTPFKTKEQFSRFYEAVLMKKELDEAFKNKKDVVIKNICDEVFNKLKFIDDVGKWKRHSPNYLQKFSAEYKYITILNKGIGKLNKQPEDVKVWLEFLIENYPSNSAIGFWFKQLAHITLNSSKNYESAAQIVINAFEFDKREKKFDLIQIYELTKISYKLRTTKAYQLCTLYCDKLIALTELPIETDYFPKKLITSGTVRSGTRGKRIYLYRDANNEVTYGNVESIALESYSNDENYEGIHCEGKLIMILFNLLFWDIIYEYYVPLTFISKFQNAPLDMYSNSFYENRKEEIDLRLKEIAGEWSEEKMVTFLKENWKNHSHKRSIADFDGLQKDPHELLDMFRCIDRNILSKIFGRLVTNYKKFRSGLPDLFLWKKESSKCKFVEVKGENDTLQLNQILWIKHLLEVGADVEVCHVSGVGFKKKLAEEFEKDKHLEDGNE